MTPAAQQASGSFIMRLGILADISVLPVSAAIIFKSPGSCERGGGGDLHIVGIVTSSCAGGMLP